MTAKERKKLIGKRIKEMRIAANMTQAQLGAALGNGVESDRGKSTISEYENGKHITIDNVIEISNVLQCDVNYLLGCQEHPDATTSWIAEQVPISGAAIQGLIKLKQDRDSDKLQELTSHNPYSTFAEAIDYMICGMLDSAGYYDDSGHYEDFSNNQTHALIFDLIKAAKALKSMDEMSPDRADANPFYADDYNNMEMSYRGILFNLGQELSNIIAAYVNKHIYKTEEV